MADEAEVDALRREYEWVLKEEVHNVLQDLHAILTETQSSPVRAGYGSPVMNSKEACRRFPVRTHPDEEKESLVKPEKYLMSSPNGVQHVKCVVTLLGDNICEADLSLRIHKQQVTPVRANIYPDVPWKIQQIQDAGNHLVQARGMLEDRDDDQPFESGHQVIDLLDRLTHMLSRGRQCLALPKKKTLEDLMKNTNVKSIKPTLPNDTVVSFYVQAQKLVLAVYQLYINAAHKLDIGSKFQAECQVPWLNDTLALFTLALQLCQQLKDKVSVFLQYEDEPSLLKREIFTEDLVSFA